MANIVLKTFAAGDEGQGTVTPQDDSLIYQNAVSVNGIFGGATVTLTGANTLHVASGFGIICGRFFEINESDISVQLSSSGTLSGRLKIHLDLNNADNPIEIVTETGATLPALSGDSNININGGAFDMELCTFSVNELTISSLVNTFPTIDNTSKQIRRKTAYAVNDFVLCQSASDSLIFICTTAGTTAIQEPTAYASVASGSSVTDGTAVFKTYNLYSWIEEKAPKSHASTGTTYGIGTPSKYGHCKTINGLTQSSHADGTALSAYQGKVLNDKIKTAQDILDKLTARVILFDNKEAHIRHDITSRISELPAAIASGHPEAYGFYEGDYFTGASGYVYILADFDHWYGAYDSGAIVSTRHWGVLVDTKLTTKWNDSSTAGGYVGSTLHSLLTGTVLTNVKSDMAALGLSLITNQRLYSNTVTTTAWNRLGTASGASTSWAWFTGQIISAPTEAEMYGHIAVSSSGYDTGEGFKPLAVCQKYRPNELFGNRAIWLRDVASDSVACLLGSDGQVNAYTVSYTWAAVGLIGIY